MTLPKSPSFRLDGQHALVTGASSGIGLACAAALAEAGAHVTCVARGADRLHDAVSQMRAEGWKADALVLDVGDVTAMRTAIAALPALDVVVNSAGLARHSPALETKPEDFDAVMNINLRAAYFLSTAAAEKMIGRGGSIIHISSQMVLDSKRLVSVSSELKLRLVVSIFTNKEGAHSSFLRRILFLRASCAGV